MITSLTMNNLTPAITQCQCHAPRATGRPVQPILCVASYTRLPKSTKGVSSTWPDRLPLCPFLIGRGRDSIRTPAQFPLVTPPPVTALHQCIPHPFHSCCVYLSMRVCTQCIWLCAPSECSMNILVSEDATVRTRPNYLMQQQPVGASHAVAKRWAIVGSGGGEGAIAIQAVGRHGGQPMLSFLTPTRELCTYFAITQQSHFDFAAWIQSTVADKSMGACLGLTPADMYVYL